MYSAIGTIFSPQKGPFTKILLIADKFLLISDEILMKYTLSIIERRSNYHTIREREIL